MSGREDPRLKPKPIPFSCKNAYDAFLKLYKGERIDYSEIKAFIEVTYKQLTPTEIDAIMNFSDTVLNTQQEIQRKKAQFKVEKK